MACLRNEARNVLEEARDGILWIALWKTGKSWHCETICGVEYNENSNDHWEIDDDCKDRLYEILEEDPEACLVNGYYCNLGPLEDMTLDSLIDGLKFQYSFGGTLARIVEDM